MKEAAIRAFIERARSIEIGLVAFEGLRWSQCVGQKSMQPSPHIGVRLSRQLGWFDRNVMRQRSTGAISFG